MSGWLMLAVSLTVVGLGALGFWRALRSSLTRRQRVVIWVTAVLLGAATLLLPAYPIDWRTRAIGFPLPAAFFQRDDDGHWLDFVGPLTVPFFFANAAINGGVVLLIQLTWLRRRNAGVQPR